MRLTRDGIEQINSTLERLVIRALMARQSGRCSVCTVLLAVVGYQLTHKRYGLDITLNDLELKCGLCHAQEH